MSIKVKWDYSIGITGLAGDLNGDTGKAIFIFPYSLEEYFEKLPDADACLDAMRKHGDIKSYRFCNVQDEELRIEIEGIFDYQIYCDILNNTVTGFDCYPIACIYKPPKIETRGGEVND